MKGKVIIGISILVWIFILSFITFFSNNQYLNFMIFYVGIMITLLGISYGCELDGK
jgi:hypothetical protein